MGDPGGSLAGVEFGHRGLARVGLAGVLEPCGAPDEQPRGLDAALHLGQLELHRLLARDRLPEGPPLLRVAHRFLEGRPHHAERLSRHTDAARVQHAHRDLESLALGPEPLVEGHLHVLERQRHGVRAAQAHLVLCLADHEARRSALEDERGEAAAARRLVGAREDQVDARLLAVRHPVLASSQYVVLFRPRGGCLDRARVRAGAGLGERERGELARDQPRQEAPALLVGAEAEHRKGPDRVVDRDHDGERRRDARDLLEHDQQRA